LICLRRALAWRVARAGRPGQAAAEHTSVARLLHERYGNRPPSPFWLFGELLSAPWYRALAGRSAGEVGRLLDISEQAQAAGDRLASSMALMNASSLSVWFGTPKMRSALRRQVSPHLEYFRPWPGTWDGECAGLFEGAVKDGLWDEAERLAPSFESWQHETGVMRQSMWHACMGLFASARGDCNEALDHYEHVIAHARLWDWKDREQESVERAER
jgi:hypothetical protein